MTVLYFYEDLSRGIFLFISTNLFLNNFGSTMEFECCFISIVSGENKAPSSETGAVFGDILIGLQLCNLVNFKSEKRSC